jgi:hypothetical protein
MSEAYMSGRICGTIGRENDTASAADFLSLAAAPTFAGMALLTGIFSSGTADVLCSVMHGGSPLSGMGLMYALMSAFHLGPWLRLISSRPAGP